MSRGIGVAEVRFVRCPNCRLVLPEIAHIPVYQCGGCGTTLQAKNRSGTTTPSEITETNSTILQSEDVQDDRAAASNPLGESGRLAFPDTSVLKADNGNAQQVEAELNESQCQSSQERKENWTTQSSSSEDTSHGSYGGGSCERAENGGGPDEYSRGREKRFNLIQPISDEFPIDERKQRPPTLHDCDDRRMMSKTQNPLYDPHFQSRTQSPKVEEGLDGSSGSLHHPRRSRLEGDAGSSLDSSGELIHKACRQGTQSSTQTQTVSEQLSNSKLSNGSLRFQHNDRFVSKQYRDSRHHSPVGFCEETNGVKNLDTDAVFEDRLFGLVPQKGQFSRKNIDNLSNKSDHDNLNQMERVATHLMVPTRQSQFQSHSQLRERSFDLSMDHSRERNFDLSMDQTRERSFDSFTDQMKSTQFELQSQMRERNMDSLMDRRKAGEFQLQSEVRERNLDSLLVEAKPTQFQLQSQTREGKADYSQGSCSSQRSQHGKHRREFEKNSVLGVGGERSPRLLRNMMTRSERSEFYMCSDRALSQFNHEGYNYGEYNHYGNLSGMHETELLKQQRMELLRKLDDLRDQLSRSSELFDASTIRDHQKIIEKQRCQTGHGDVYLVNGNGEDALQWGDYSVGSNGISENHGNDTWTWHTPQEKWGCLHLKPESESDTISRHSHSVMDESYMEMSNGLVSDHMHPQNLGSYRSQFKPCGPYVDKNTVCTSQRVPQVPFSREQGITHRHQVNHSPYQSVEMDHNNCNYCSRHSLQHAGACCSHSSYKHWHSQHIPLQVPPTVCCHAHMCSAANRHIHSHHLCPTPVGVQASAAQHLPSHPSHQEYHGQKSMTKESELIVYKEKKQQEPIVAKRRTYPCLPFAGGAPFALCDNCLQLLLIPANLPSKWKRKHKLRCGACSSIFVFTIHDKKHSVAAPKCIDYPCDSQETELSAANYASSSSTCKGTPHSHGNDYSLSMSKSRSANGKPGFSPFSALEQNVSKSRSLSTQSRFPIARADERHHVHTIQSARGQDHVPFQQKLHDKPSSGAFCLLRDEANSAEVSPGDDSASPLAGSPLHQHFGYSSPSQMINKCLQEKTSVASHQKSMDLGDSDKTFDWEHTKGARKPAVMVFPPHVHSSLGTSTDLVENEHHEDLSKESGWSWNTSFTGFLKKSIRDFKKGNQGSEVVRPKVSVNGVFIPDPLIKKVEVYAGPIHPGHYWYDYHAGFWGLMGEPCLGIIPPFIEEFNYTMPRDCAGGDTCILVNGRELHQKDLELLAGRGLPTTKDKAYIIEISGRVLDEASGTELKSLGKLAPTLEKIGRGVGMRAPKRRS
eukprot:Gb_15603 [translate_table: standard]